MIKTCLSRYLFRINYQSKHIRPRLSDLYVPNNSNENLCIKRHYVKQKHFAVNNYSSEIKDQETLGTIKRHQRDFIKEDASRQILKRQRQRDFNEEVVDTRGNINQHSTFDNLQRRSTDQRRTYLPNDTFVTQPREHGRKFNAEDVAEQIFRRNSKYRNPERHYNEQRQHISNDPDTFGTLERNDFEDEDVTNEHIFKAIYKRKRLLDYIFDIRNLSRKGRTKEALEVYDSLFEMGVKIDSQHVFTVAISVCGKVGHVKKAFKVLKQLRDRGYKPSPATLTGLFNSCAESPFPLYGLKKAEHLREQMNVNGWQPTGITYHAMIKAFGRCGDINTAFELVDEMRTKEFVVNAETFNFVLMSCIERKERGFGLAMLVMRKMEQFRILPEERTFNLMLRAARDCQIGPSEIVTQLFSNIDVSRLIQGSSLDENRLLTSGQPSNETGLLPGAEVLKMEPSVNVLTQTEGDEKGLRLTDKPELLGLKPIVTRQDRLMLLGGSKGIVAKMLKLNRKPSVKTFNLILECSDSSIESEMALLDEMKSNNVLPDIGFMNSLIKSRCARREYLQARDVLDMLGAYNLEADLSTFGALAMTCVDNAQAKRFLRDMESSGVRPNVVILGALFSTARHRSDYHLVVYLMKMCCTLGVTPDVKVIKDLEILRTNGKKALLQFEFQRKRDSSDDVKPEIDEKSFAVFCKMYNSWLKNVQVDIGRNPLKQYEPNYGN